MASGTPIIVGRTPRGFLIGTNVKRSDGSLTCKVRYSRHRVLILGGQPVTIVAVQGAKRTTLINIDRDLREINLANLKPDLVFQSVRKMIARDLESQKHVIATAFREDPFFIAVLVTEDGPRPEIWTEEMTFSRQDLLHPTYSLGSPDLRSGDLLEKFKRNGFEFPHVPTISAVMIEKELNRIAQMPHTSPYELKDQSFEPPFLIISLDPTGVKLLTSGQLPCAPKHQTD